MTKISGSSKIRVLPGFFLLISFSFSLSTLAADDRVFFQVDPDAHTSEITDIVATKDGAYAVTGSLDKTIRVWDLSLRREVRQILGEAGEGDFGKIQAIALSPDDQVLASGGIFGPETSASAGDVRLYDFNSGTLKRRLSGSTSPVTDLAFLSDGAYLAAGREDATITIWDCKNGYAVCHTFSDPGIKEKVNGITLFRDQDAVLLAAAVGDNLLVYSVTAKLLVAKKDMDDPVYSVCIDEKNKRIVVALKFSARSGSVYLYDYKLAQKGFFNAESGVEDLSIALSPDAGFILVAGNTDKNQAVLFYNDVKSRKYLMFPEVEKVSAIAFADSSRAVVAGGTENALYVWDFIKGEEILLSKSTPVIRDVGIDSSTLYIGFDKTGAGFRFDLAIGLQDNKITEGIRE
ncbi:MAG: hypothetical protein EHM28_09200, partial [Spirochaetaceae bacterium]